MRGAVYTAAAALPERVFGFCYFFIFFFFLLPLRFPRCFIAFSRKTESRNRAVRGVGRAAPKRGRRTAYPATHYALPHAGHNKPCFARACLSRTPYAFTSVFIIGTYREPRIRFNPGTAFLNYDPRGAVTTRVVIIVIVTPPHVADGRLYAAGPARRRCGLRNTVVPENKKNIYTNAY